MKQFTLLFFLFFLKNVDAQISTASKYQNMFTSEAHFSVGKNNYGPGVMVGYFFSDDKTIRFGATKRFFEYKDYNENILELNLDYGQTVFAFDRYSDLGAISFTAVGGFALEAVKVTSETKIIEPYPKYYYTYVGVIPEYTFNDNWSLSLFFRQFYAINGKKETLGKYRYDTGLSLRYYFY